MFRNSMVEGDISREASMMEQKTIHETPQLMGRLTAKDAANVLWFPSRARLRRAAAESPAAVLTRMDSNRFSNDSPTMLPPHPANEIRAMDSKMFCTSVTVVLLQVVESFSGVRSSGGGHADMDSGITPSSATFSLSFPSFRDSDSAMASFKGCLDNDVLYFQ
jgi:hypothetical protein